MDGWAGPGSRCPIRSSSVCAAGLSRAARAQFLPEPLGLQALAVHVGGVLAGGGGELDAGLRVRTPGPAPGRSARAARPARQPGIPKELRCWLSQPNLSRTNSINRRNSQTAPALAIRSKIYFARIIFKCFNSSTLSGFFISNVTWILNILFFAMRCSAWFAARC